MKYCKKCGSRLKEGAKFCTKCGMAINISGRNDESLKKQSNVSYFNNSFLKRNRKIGKKQIALVVVTILVFILAARLISVFLVPGYEKPVKNMVKCINTGKMKYMKNAIPEDLFVQYSMNEKNVDEDKAQKLFDEAMTEVEDGMLSLKKEYGNNFKMSYEILSKKKLDLSANICERYRDMGAEIKDGYRLNVKFKFKSGELENEENTTIDVVKIGSKWYMDLELLL